MAPVAAFQFPEKPVAVMLVAAVAVGAAGTVVTVIVFEFPLVALPLYARRR